MTATTYLTLEDALQLAAKIFGAPPLVRDLGLLDSAIHRPSSSMFGQDAYETLPLKAAALLDSVCRNHALVDGNKRLGLAVTLAFLRLNGYRLHAPDDDLYDLVIAVASVHLEVDKIAVMLEQWMVPV